MKSAHVMVGLLVVTLLAANTAVGFEIRVAPGTLVLSSSGGQLTVHTNVPIRTVEDIELYVNDNDVGAVFFADNLGNVVAQCSKATAAEFIPEFTGKTTTATVTLMINGDSVSEDITVKK